MKLRLGAMALGVVLICTSIWLLMDARVSSDGYGNVRSLAHARGGYASLVSLYGQSVCDEAVVARGDQVFLGVRPWSDPNHRSRWKPENVDQPLSEASVRVDSLRVPIERWGNVCAVEHLSMTIEYLTLDPPGAHRTIEKKIYAALRDYERRVRRGDVRVSAPFWVDRRLTTTGYTKRFRMTPFGLTMTLIGACGIGLLVHGLAGVVRVVRVRARVRAGRCAICRYDLRGLGEGVTVCPECGVGRGA